MTHVADGGKSCYYFYVVGDQLQAFVEVAIGEWVICAQRCVFDARRNQYRIAQGFVVE